MTDHDYPTGEQFDLVWPENGTPRAHAVVTEIGAMLRVLEFDGVPVVHGFEKEVAPLFCAGWMLAPWPNRVRDGRWNDAGIERQLPLTEPERGNALHGFLFALHHTVVRRTESSITLRASIQPTDGYPFALTVDTAFELGQNTLTVTHTLANVGERPAPAALGAHPYFRIGDVPIPDLVVTVDAATRVTVDDRLNPTGTAPVEGTPYDLRGGVRVGDLDLDTAYLDLAPAADGRYVHTIEAPDARRIELWGDANYSQAQVFTTQIFPTSSGPGWGVTVEPTTAAPDALNTGELRTIDPGESWTASWGVTFVPGPVSALAFDSASDSASDSEETA
ncbi:aldose epimerase [Subtercola sp. Z020]|uniref:aldose 1-epimerase family protein n=1 Tax=Subtercola sp. Z020 TaxID=2080582 RepID=UPI000CE8587E|nr:aldose 1-epimerase family protein [Subtercola sp. Z020]PPF77860.1 aldose epimerase [Subtercola sp. Z020]